MIQCDVEIGGTDQLFNLLIGRDLQKKYGLSIQQDILTVPLLEGTDGSAKMSKSEKNYISLQDTPAEMFGKIMSIPDTLLLKYFELCTNEDLESMIPFVKNDPRNAKVHLAKSIIMLYHTKKEADTAEQDFITKFVKKDTPDKIPCFSVSEPQIGILDLITKICGFADSNSNARRLVEQGGVSIDGEKIKDPKSIISLKNNMILKAGKRKWGKIKI